MKRTLQEEIERMNHIVNYDQLLGTIPKTIERDEDDIRNKPVLEKSYRDQTIKKDWLGMFSTEVNGNQFISNKEWKVMEFIDNELDKD